MMRLIWSGTGAILTAEKCAACLTCVRICPHKVPVIQDGTVRIETARCQACGICTTECPAKAVAMMYHRENTMFRIIEAFSQKFAESKPAIIAFRCFQPGYASTLEQVLTPLPENIQIINVVCTAKVDMSYVLKGFEVGADGIFLTACPEGQCLHTIGNQFAQKRVEALKKQLDDLGLGSQRLEIFIIPPGDDVRFTEVAVEMTDRVKNLGQSPLRRR